MSIIRRILRLFRRARPGAAPAVPPAIVVPAPPPAPLRIEGRYLIGPMTDYDDSPNHGGKFGAEPEIIVMHYTAGATMGDAVQTLTDGNRRNRVSAHFVVGRDGAIVQLVPVDTIAWHAGRSQWGDISGLNAYSIGIEMVNAGELDYSRMAWWGDYIGDADTVSLQHRHNGWPSYWHTYPDVQVQRVEALCRALQRRYSITIILGHDDIAPGRKVDPGPAFDMDDLRARLGLPLQIDRAEAVA